MTHHLRIVHDATDTLMCACVVSVLALVCSVPRVAMAQADVQEHPEESVVALFNARGLACSGTVIARRTVLTARHCLPIQSVRFENGSKTRVASAEKAPGRFDLALLRLEKPVPTALLPIAVAKKPGAFSKQVRIVGFGRSDARKPGERRWWELELRGWGCSSANAMSSGCSPGFELVIQRGVGRDTCTGDSGGPVLQRVDGQWTVIAITSRAVKNSLLECGDGGVYQRVDVLHSWLARRLGQPEKRGNG